MSKPRNINALNTITKPGETILWTGNPATGSGVPLTNAVPLYISGLIVLVSLALSTIQPVFLVWGIGGMLVLPIYFLLYLIIRMTVIYRVTNQRIIIFSDFISQSVRQKEIQSIKDINLRIHRNGTGTISFDKGSWSSWIFWSPNPNSSLAPLKFECVKDPRTVYEMIKHLREEIRPPTD